MVETDPLRVDEDQRCLPPSRVHMVGSVAGSARRTTVTSQEQIDFLLRAVRGFRVSSASTLFTSADETVRNESLLHAPTET